MVTEGRAIARGGAFTRRTVAADLARLGVPEGGTVLVHSSLSALGYVVGGAQTVVLALLDCLGSAGTLVMPAHSAEYSDPSGWSNPPVAPAWWPVIRDEMPAFDPVLTPTRGMGAIVECFRHVPGVQRSDHPQVSFVAHGPGATGVVQGHELTNGMGERSPLARVYDLDGFVLLLGVGHGNNTSLHLAEHRAPRSLKRWITQSAAVSVEGERRWTSWSDLEGDTDDFEAVGRAFGATGGQVDGVVGSGRAFLMRQRLIVDFAAAWFSEHRQGDRPRSDPARRSEHPDAKRE
jgi:aminoglycoside 3-N-acetyltransferase